MLCFPLKRYPCETRVVPVHVQETTMTAASICGCRIARRQFLAGSAALAMTPTLGWRANAQTQNRPAPGHRIDMHHHFLPPQYMKEEHERPHFGQNLSAGQLLAWTPSQSLEVMDQNGIATAI